VASVFGVHSRPDAAFAENAQTIPTQANAKGKRAEVLTPFAYQFRDLSQCFGETPSPILKTWIRLRGRKRPSLAFGLAIPLSAFGGPRE
jgi:hypothetical protein